MSYESLSTSRQCLIKDVFISIGNYHGLSVFAIENETEPVTNDQNIKENQLETTKKQPKVRLRPCLTI